MSREKETCLAEHTGLNKSYISINALQISVSRTIQYTGYFFGKKLEGS